MQKIKNKIETKNKIENRKEKTIADQINIYKYFQTNEC